MRDFLTISGGVYCALGITLKGYGSRVIFLVIEPQDDALTEMIRRIGTRFFAAEVLVGLKKVDQVDLAGIDFPAAKRMAR